MQRLHGRDAPRADSGYAADLVQDRASVLSVAVERDEKTPRNSIGRILDEDAAVREGLDREGLAQAASSYFTGAGTVSVTSYFLSV